MERRTGWPKALRDEPVGPWQTRQAGPFQVRYRRKDRYAVERRRLRRAWLVFLEHLGRESGFYRFAAWMARWGRGVIQ